MDKLILVVTVIMIVLLIQATAHLLVDSNAKIIKKSALIWLGIAIILWLCGCSALKNDEDISIILASKGTVIKTEVFDSGHCKVIIKDDNGLVLGIIKKDSSPCAKLKKSDRVSLSVILQPSLIAPGSIEKL